MSKRKKHQGMRCVLFPDDVKDVFRKSRKEPVKTSTPGKAWERCGDSFLDTSVVQNLQTSEKKSRRVRKEVQTHVTGVREAGADDPVNIAWSSSEAEESDNESHPRPAVIQTPQTSKRHRHHPVDHHRSLRMLGATVDEDDLPSIDSDSEAEEDNSTSKDQTDFLNPIASPAEISVYSSNDDEDPEENRTDSSLVDTADTSRQSVSEWVRSAQAILQTPKKPTTTTIKTPEDSNKKNRKFERGGLAEKLNRLHSRQRSAISFWRHQCNSSASAADRPGVLTLRILGVREECGMQAAVCDRLSENEKCVAMFSKDTAAQLQPTPGDIVHIYPPWQNLVVEGERFPVILNTHFSQKVCVETDNTGCLTSVVSVEKCRPPQLTRCLWRSEMSQSERSVSCEQPQVSELSRSDRRCVRDSLLDAVEDCGLPGSQSGPVEVVVQRLYCIPISSDRASLQHRNPGKHPSRPEPSDRVGRLCAIVQDGYGMFADVLLQSVSDAEIKKISEELEGRICVLQGLRVIQRLTRDRCSSLFSLIDSLWPPLVAPKSHEDLLQSPSGRVPPPNFCYRLSVQQGRMVPVSGQNMSPLYQSPVLRTLREITQEESMKRRCSFRAALVHKHLLGSNTGEMLLFVTDPSLQTDPSAEAIRKTVSVCVSPSCLMRSSVTQALTESQRRPLLRFRDAVINRGQLFCVEQTVIELEPDEPSFSVSRTVILDQLSPDIPPYSLCSLTGVIVEVDESTAFSWPACCQCGSCRLETAQVERRRFHCLMCGAVMDEPTTKMQLEVFLTCPSMRHCNVKVKLQQKTITSLLNSTRGAEGYTVESILGREIGPLSVLVHVINRRPNVWMVLEEFDLP